MWVLSTQTPTAPEALPEAQVISGLSCCTCSDRQWLPSQPGTSWIMTTSPRQLRSSAGSTSGRLPPPSHSTAPQPALLLVLPEQLPEPLCWDSKCPGHQWEPVKEAMLGAHARTPSALPYMDEGTHCRIPSQSEKKLLLSSSSEHSSSAHL